MIIKIYVILLRILLLDTYDKSYSIVMLEKKFEIVIVKFVLTTLK